MPIYILKRMLAMIPTLLGIAFVTFLIISLAPGDPVATSFGAGADERSTGSGGGGAQNRDRLADAIKAKKKLLGIMAEDYNVIVWNAAEAGKVRVEIPEGASRFMPHELELEGRIGDFGKWVKTLALSPDGKTLYAAGDGKKILLLDLATGQVLRSVGEHKDAIMSLALSEDGTVLLSADESGVIKGWKADSGEMLFEGEPYGTPVRALKFLPDGQQFLSACDDGLIRLHDSGDGKVSRELEGHVAGVYTLAVDRSGKRFWSAGYDRKLREWSLTTYKVVSTIEGHGQAINRIVLSRDGTKLATACDDRKIRVFSIGEGPLESDAEFILLEAHYKAVTALAFASDGKTLFSGSRDETVRSWNIEEATSTTMAKDTTGLVGDLLLSADGTTLFSASESWATVPIYVRFLKWLSRLARFDFDRSFVDDRPVIDKIMEALPVTLVLNLIALLIIYLVAIPIGIMAAVKRGSMYDHLSSLVLFILYSVPNFWFATLLIMTFSSKQNWDILPSVGIAPENAWDLSYFQWLGQSFLHLVLPIIVLVYAGFASLSRYARTSMLESISQDYVRTARAKGLQERLVIYKHAFRNSLITIVTLIGSLLPRMIGGSVIVEYIFSIHGMGKLGFDAILARDYPTIMAITTFSALLTLLGILISDILYSVVDPRITHS